MQFQTTKTSKPKYIEHPKPKFNSKQKSMKFLMNENLFIVALLLVTTLMTKVMVVKSEDWIEIRGKTGQNYNGRLHSGAAFSAFGAKGYYRLQGPLGLGERSASWDDNDVIVPRGAIIGSEKVCGINPSLGFFMMSDDTGWPNAIRVDCMNGYSDCSEDGIQIKKAKFAGNVYKNFALVPTWNWNGFGGSLGFGPTLEEVNTCGNRKTQYSYSDGGVTYTFYVQSCLTMKPNQFYKILGTDTKNGVTFLVLQVVDPIEINYSATCNGNTKSYRVDLGSCDYDWNKDLAVCGGTSTYSCNNNNGCARRSLEEKKEVLGDDHYDGGYHHHDDTNQSDGGSSVFGDVGMISQQQGEEQRGLLRGGSSDAGTVYNDAESGSSVTVNSRMTMSKDVENDFVVTVDLQD